MKKIPSIKTLKKDEGKLEVERRHDCAKYKRAGKNTKTSTTKNPNDYNIIGMGNSQHQTLGAYDTTFNAARKIPRGSNINYTPKK